MEVETSGRIKGSHVKIMALMWADILAAYSVWMMMKYLTDVWMISFTRAAAMVNIFMGVASVLPIGIVFLVDVFFGNFWMLFLSSAAYSIGLGFLSMSTPPVLSNVTGTCSSYKEECIGSVQKGLLYASLALMAFGMAGHIVSLGSFLVEQINATDEDGDEEEEQSGLAIVGFIGVVLIPIISAIAISYIKPWSVRFGIPAICTVVATLIFVAGSCSYILKGPKGSPYTRLFRVFIASTMKMHLPLPRDANQLYENTDLGEEEVLVPHTKGLRCLDKAAIISPTPALEEQEKNRWKLCSVTEVEEMKITLRMIPMWMTFIVVGLVMSIGNTFFLEQASHMNPKVGKWKLPLPVLLMFYDTAKSQAIKFYYIMASCCGESFRKYAPAVGMALGMLLSVLCCITAAKVEERRIGVIEKHGLLDKPDERIPMSMFWLLPQFLLLGGLEGLAYESVACFFRDQVPPSLSGHLIIFTGGVFGAGTLGSVLSVYIVGKISKRGGRPGWFRHTLNKSRLDNYYWTLAVLSSINLVIYVLIAIWYAYRDSAEDEEEEPEDEDEPNYEEMCCCCL